MLYVCIVNGSFKVCCCAKSLKNNEHEFAKTKSNEERPSATTLMPGTDDLSHPVMRGGGDHFFFFFKGGVTHREL